MQMYLSHQNRAAFRCSSWDCIDSHRTIFLYAKGAIQLCSRDIRLLKVPLLAAVVIGFLQKSAALAAKIVIPDHVVLYGLSKIYLEHIYFLYILAVLFPFSVGVNF
ncbi:hypothetical protein [Bacillus inaquosorum]|uniref:hypothetical protein n=1 Tax=Bacillus inaquosorum TaxID=483913 RepID=UPI002282160F|nr:hypothetical protein [Bacillus inaquosorum]MCY8146149.1 hypothetical protein [Bacillus inaquosorum]MCY8854853.1 hypothetical protein [Bacillus inaquosorum]MED1171930.1 hypothetical protein [Bacillus inaquosorum]MED1541525.1 hypothetical protein [Bacillus inaquosorum]